MDPNGRFLKALEAMKALGIGENKVESALDRLLRLYDNKWGAIEDENYRILVDAILEQDERMKRKEKGKNSELQDEQEKPLKRRQSIENGTGSNSHLPSPSSLPGSSGKGSNNKPFERKVSQASEASHMLQIASSSSGEVKINLTCNLNDKMGKFYMPSEEQVHEVLAKELKRSLGLDPKISIKSFLNAVCESALRVGTNAAKPFQITQSNGVSDSHLVENYASENVSRIAKKEENVYIGCEQRVPSNEHVGNGRPQNASRDVRLRFCSDGMTKGYESAEISITNECVECPFFNYTPQNFVFQDASLKFTLSSIKADRCCPSCIGDCLSNKCCRCGKESFYTTGGRLKESFLNEFISFSTCSKKSVYYCDDCPLNRWRMGSKAACKGHPNDGKFIKECWVKCGCNVQCGNRVVQRGIKRKLNVFYVPEEKRWGLRTVEGFQKGSFVCEYVGEIMTVEEWYQRKSRWMRKSGALAQWQNYPILLDAFWHVCTNLGDNEALCLDGTYYANIARFITHKRVGANLIGIPVIMEPSSQHYYHVALFTTREINPLEELAWDYVSALDDSSL